ncbi:NUDIX domain-containing protein [Roseivirga pacifica]
MSERIKIINEKVISDRWFTLKDISFDYTKNNGEVQRQDRVVYHKDNYSAILLYNSNKNSIILTKQFRMPAYINTPADGFVIEVCAGMLDNDSPEEAVIREAEEETGYRVKQVQKVFECYTSPGTLSELAHLYVGEYEDNMKVTEGGGTDADEDIEVLETPFRAALEMVKTGEIKDAKTIMLIQYAQLQGLLK